MKRHDNENNKNSLKKQISGFLESKENEITGFLQEIVSIPTLGEKKKR